MTVDELIAGWTEEEKENLKELIEECREREKSIEENRRLSLEGLKRLADEIVGDLVDYFYREKYTLRC
jgi:ABC-type branched-subunit amino acid transport system ATPase component